MLELMKGYVGEAAAPFIFLAVFLLIVGSALWLTPRLAAWLDKASKKNPGYFDGMLEEPLPENKKDTAETTETEETEEKE